METVDVSLSQRVDFDLGATLRMLPQVVSSIVKPRG